MRRATCKEIIAHAIYQLRKEAGLEGYGSSDSDQSEAERIIKFFEDLNNKDVVTIRDWQWEKTFEDYRIWQSICESIADD